MPFYSTAYYLLVVIFKPFTSSSTSHINSQVRTSLWLSGRIAQWSATDPGSIPIGNEFGCRTRAEQEGCVWVSVSVCVSLLDGRVSRLLGQSHLY